MNDEPIATQLAATEDYSAVLEDLMAVIGRHRVRPLGLLTLAAHLCATVISSTHFSAGELVDLVVGLASDPDYRRFAQSLLKKHGLYDLDPPGTATEKPS